MAGWVVVMTVRAASSSPDSSVTPVTCPCGDADPGHRRGRADLRAEVARRRREGLGHPAHAAAREPPRGLADVVVEHDVRGAGRARPRPRADHPADRQHAPHRVGLEPVLDQVGDAVGEDPGDVDGRAYVEVLQHAQQPGLAEEVGGTARAEPGRDPLEERAEDAAQLAHPRVPALVRRGVLAGEPADLLSPPRRIVGQPQVAAVGARREVGTLRVDVVPVAVQPQVADQRGGSRLTTYDRDVTV